MREIVSLLYAACTRVPTYVRIVRQQFMHALLTHVRPCDNLCLFRSYLRVSRVSLPTAKLCPGISGYRRHVHAERAFSVSLRTYVWKTRLKWVFHQNSVDDFTVVSLRQGYRLPMSRECVLHLHHRQRFVQTSRNAKSH